MNRERIKDLARFCGFDWQRYWDEDEENQIEVFANLIEREVREQQQKVMEQLIEALQSTEMFLDYVYNQDIDSLSFNKLMTQIIVVEQALAAAKEAGYE